MHLRTTRHDQTTGGPLNKGASVGMDRTGGPQGFTLLELVLVLTLLALLTAAAIPSVYGLRESAQAREPLTSLAKLAKETRLRAMRDRRPYQIAFTATGFKATRYISPYLQAAQIEEFIQRSAIETQQKEEAGLLPNSQAPSNVPSAPASPEGAPTPPPVFKEWTESVALPEGMIVSVREWHEADGVTVSGDAVKLWVFQPSGMVTPITVTLQLNSNVFTADFSALTADIVKETATTL